MVKGQQKVLGSHTQRPIIETFGSLIVTKPKLDASSADQLGRKLQHGSSGKWKLFDLQPMTGWLIGPLSIGARKTDAYEISRMCPKMIVEPADLGLVRCDVVVVV